MNWVSFFVGFGSALTTSGAFVYLSKRHLMTRTHKGFCLMQILIGITIVMIAATNSSS